MYLTDDWNYYSANENPADVATRPVTVVTSKDRLKLYQKNIRGTEPFVVQVKQATATTTISEGTLQHLIEAAPDWCSLKKRVGYHMAFTKYFFKNHAKNAGKKFAKPRLDAAYLDKAKKKCFKVSSKITTFIFFTHTTTKLKLAYSRTFYSYY